MFGGHGDPGVLDPFFTAGLGKFTLSRSEVEHTGLKPTTDLLDDPIKVETNMKKVKKKT